MAVPNMANDVCNDCSAFQSTYLIDQDITDPCKYSGTFPNPSSCTMSDSGEATHIRVDVNITTAGGSDVVVEVYLYLIGADSSEELVTTWENHTNQTSIDCNFSSYEVGSGYPYKCDPGTNNVILNAV